MLNLTYNYKLQPTTKQIEIIEHNLNVCKSVWNHALSIRKLWYNSGSCEINKCSLKSEYIVKPFEYPNYHFQSSELTKAKKTNEFLKSGNAQAMQQTLRKLDRAFNDMKSKGMGFPRYKKTMKSFNLIGKFSIEDNYLTMPLLKSIKLRKSRDLPNGFKIKQVQIQLAHQLCEGVGMIFVEDINFVSWSKGLFCKQSLDMGLGQFFTTLEYVCSQTDTYFAKVNKDYASQICPSCGTHTGKKELNVRVHNCPECGYVQDRDVAAAEVIRNRGAEINTAVGAPVVKRTGAVLGVSPMSDPSKKQPSNGVLAGEKS